MFTSLSARSTALNNGLGLSGPPLGWSSWNKFTVHINASLIRETGNALVDSGLAKLGYRYVNIDDGWATGRHPNGSIAWDEQQFPGGFKPLADYLHAKGLLLGIYSARGNSTCANRPGSAGFETIDAQFYADSGVDYLKYDSCDGSDDPAVAWAQYATMGKALNATGRPIWYVADHQSRLIGRAHLSHTRLPPPTVATFLGALHPAWRRYSITSRMAYNDSLYHAPMHCVGPLDHPPRDWAAFTVRPWQRMGKDVSTIANSFLIEYCNNHPVFGFTNGIAGPTAPATAHPVGFLSQLDSQQLLTEDNYTMVGSYNVRFLFGWFGCWGL